MSKPLSRLTAPPPTLCTRSPRLANKVVHCAGGCVVIADLLNPHDQVFLRGHDDDVSTVAVSPSGYLIASGQIGEHADVLVWACDPETFKWTLLYRFSEHDEGIECMSFSHDDRLLATCGSLTDNKMIIWDIKTGGIVCVAPP